MPSTRASVSRRLSRAPSRQSHDEHEDRRWSHRHRRSMSNMTAVSTKSMISTSSRRDLNRRRIMRTSLLGPQVEELTIERRADILNDIAGDCIVKIIRAGLKWNRSTWMECKLSWDLVQSHRRSNLFGEDVPPFVMWEDAQHELPHYSARDLVTLNRTMEVCNLVTLAYVVLRPDDALSIVSAAITSRKGKEKAKDSNITRKAEMRNRIMLDAWEKFWLIIPEDQKDKETPLRLWLEFVTQIYITHRNPSIDPPSLSSESLPGLSEDSIHDMFDPEAINRFGRWNSEDSLETDGTGIAGLTQEIVGKRWARVIERRYAELNSTHHEELQRRYPYDAFRREMLKYLEMDIVGTGFHLPASDFEASSEDESGMDSASESQAIDDMDVKPRRSSTRSPVKMPYGPLHGSRRTSHHGRRPSDRSVRVSTGAGDEDLDSDLEAAEASLGEEEDIDAVGADDPLEWDMFAEVAREMEMVRQLHNRRQHNEKHQTPNKRRKTGDAVEADDWEVRDGVTPRAIVSRQEVSNSFNFAMRQPTAVQVEWETQTPARSSEERLRQSSHPQKGAHSASDQSQASHLPSRSTTPSRIPTFEGSLPTPESQATPRASVSLNLPNVGNALQRRTGLRSSRSISRDQRSVTPSQLGYGSSTRQLRDASVPAVLNRQVRSPQPRAHEMMQDGIEAYDDLLPDPAQLSGDREPIINPTLDGSSTSEALRLSGLRAVSVESEQMDSLLPGPSQLQGDRERSVDELSVDSLLPNDDELQGDRDPSILPDDGKDLLPDSEQLLGDHPMSQDNDNEGEDDLLPDSTQLVGDRLELPEETQIQQANAADTSTSLGEDIAANEPEDEGATTAHHADDFDMVGDNGDYGDRDGDGFFDTPSVPQPPPAQRVPASGRMPSTQDATDFAVPDEEEDEEDRQFLLARQADHTDHNSTFQIKSSPPGTPIQRHHYIEEDPYLVDDDGLPLLPNDDYRIPRDFVQKRSMIHGQVEGQSTAYSRMTGKRKWTPSEALLLYRTLQRVPLDELYPLRVVWYLHGEHGVLTRDLQYFNPQHMKDKLRTTTIARSNNLKVVEGRASSFLPPAHPLRQKYEAWVKVERDRWEAELNAERDRMRDEAEARDQELKRIAAEKEAAAAARRAAEEDEDEGTSSEAEEEAPRRRRGPRRSARGTKKPPAKKRTKKGGAPSRKRKSRARKEKEPTADDYESEEGAAPIEADVEQGEQEGGEVAAEEQDVGAEAGGVEDEDAEGEGEDEGAAGSGREGESESGLDVVTSDREPTPAPVLPVKRGPGRPRKNPKPVATEPENAAPVSPRRRRKSLVPEVELPSRPSRRAGNTAAAKKKAAPKKKQKAKRTNPGGVPLPPKTPIDEADQAELDEAESTALAYEGEDSAGEGVGGDEHADGNETERGVEGDPVGPAEPPVEADEVETEREMRKRFLTQKVLRGGGV